ncbi:MAG: glycosyltransferase family 4 protein [Acidobacteria bacterium]|nr:glycosyltransferase family 4 protein [Acidobacteriota bacterium]
MALRIGVNALYLIPGGVGGTEIYLRNLLAALAEADSSNQYTIVTNRETTDLVPRAPNMRALPQAVRAANRPARILWEQVRLPGVARAERFDVLFNPGFTAPMRCPCPQVTVFHDLQHKRHPEHFRRLDLPFWNLLLWGSARRSTRLIAVSEATRQDLLRFYGVDSDVVPHGVEQAIFDLAARRQPEPFILCVSTLHPHKGLEALLEGFAEFRRRTSGYRLVLAGMRGFAAQAIEARIRDLALADSVEITGWIPRAALLDLYRRAGAFVYPSTFEGFGMPVAEAMAAGVPLACSDIEPLRSLAGDAALRFAPGDSRAIADALTRLAVDKALRERLAAQGCLGAREFTWRSAALRTRSVLEQAATEARFRG